MCDRDERRHPMKRSELHECCMQASYAMARQRGLMIAEEGAEPCKHWMRCPDFTAAVKDPEE